MKVTVVKKAKLVRVDACPWLIDYPSESTGK
jgi:hypothetical protein